MKKEELLRRVEERIEARKTMSFSYKAYTWKIDVTITDHIKHKLKTMEQEKTLYELVITYIQRLKDQRFLFKNGNVNGTAFARYACIDKSTWNDLCWGQALMSKKTLLKLVVALRLNEDEANDLMRRGSNSFDPKDIRDQIILALIDLRCYEIEDVYDVLEDYREKGHSFKNIYD